MTESPEKTNPDVNITQPMDIPPELRYRSGLPDAIRIEMTERIERALEGHQLRNVQNGHAYSFEKVETEGEHMGHYVFKDESDPGVIAYLDQKDIRWVKGSDDLVLGDAWELLPLIEAEPDDDKTVFEKMGNGQRRSPDEVKELSDRLAAFYAERTIRAPGDYKEVTFVELVYGGTGDHPYKLLFRQAAQSDDAEPETLMVTPEEFLGNFSVEEKAP